MSFLTKVAADLLYSALGHLHDERYLQSVPQQDHGGLAGLSDDDHTQYYNQTRGDGRYLRSVPQQDHGGLAGLSDDDHTQYYNETRGDARYKLLAPLAEISITGADTATIGRAHVCTGTTADYTVTLPAAANNAGKFVQLRMSPALTKLVTIDGNASEKIDNALTRVMWANESADLYCDGSNWTKIGGKSIAHRCKLTANAVQTLTTATFTTFTMDATVYDNASLGDLTTDKITIRRAGVYSVGGACSFNNNTSWNTHSRLMVASVESVVAFTNTGGYMPPNFGVANLAAGNTVYHRGYHDKGSNLDTYSAPYPSVWVEELLAW